MENSQLPDGPAAENFCALGIHFLSTLGWVVAYEIG